MPISFLTLPDHIRNDIIQKLDLSDFVKFHESSKDCFRLAMKIQTRFTYSPKTMTVREPSGYSRTKTSSLMLVYCCVNKEIGMNFVLHEHCHARPFVRNFGRFPIRFREYHVIIPDEFTEDFCLTLINIVKYTNSSINKVSLMFTISCSSETLSQLIEAAHVKEVMFSKPISPGYMRMETIRNISIFCIGSFLNEADVLLLNAPEITVLSSNITSRGINLLLKRFLARESFVRRFNIKTNQQLLEDVILDGILSSIGSYPENFIIGEGRNRYRLSIRGQNIRMLPYTYK